MATTGEHRLDPGLFAVVDCETTGLHPGRHHRIIELAIVSLGEDWEPNDVWCTLLRSERDLGPTGIHGIRGRDVRASAPRSVEEALTGQPLSREYWPRSDSRAPCRVREEIEVDAQEPSFLAGLVHGIDVRPGADALRVAPYLDVLDRAIEDRLLDSIEQEELAATAAELGLSADRVRKLHSDYIATLVALARRDGVVTDRERADLLLVGDALGIADVNGLLDRPMGGADPKTERSELTGKSVCFTGALTCHHEGALVTREIAQELAETAGMIVAARVTKKLDILVVADPDSLSGKAKKAREYGVRIVAETAFWSMIGVEVA